MQTPHIISPFILVQTKYTNHPCDNLFAYVSVQNYCPKQTLKECSDPKGSCPEQKIIINYYQRKKKEKEKKKRNKDNKSKSRVYLKNVSFVIGFQSLSEGQQPGHHAKSS